MCQYKINVHEPFDKLDSLDSDFIQTLTWFLSGGSCARIENVLPSIVHLDRSGTTGEQIQFFLDYIQIFEIQEIPLLWWWCDGPTAQSCMYCTVCVAASPSLCCCWRWSIFVWLLSARFCSCRSCWKDPSGAAERKRIQRQFERKHRRGELLKVEWNWGQVK